jgi:cytochrome bd-type quinol oxidase subunit 2
MNVEYRDKSNKAAKIWVACLIGMVAYLFIFPPNQNIWDTAQVVPIVLILGGAIAFLRFVWFYIKAKGYSNTIAVVGTIVLIFAPYLALFLIFLPDKFPIEY